MKKFDINKLSKGKSRNIKIGELSKDVIDILDLDLNPQNINIWSTRIEEHCEKHKDEYGKSGPTCRYTFSKNETNPEESQWQFQYIKQFYKKFSCLS